MSRILTLTTDFGLRDAYVAAMKGVILRIAPDVRLVDITHDVGAQDVMEAAFVLRQAVYLFPDDTVHLAVIDPGVGTDRRPVALRHGPYLFVGPDNGLFSLMLDGEPAESAVVLDRPEYWRTEAASATFHGRDIFAPVAAHLAAGRDLHEVGSPIDELTRLYWARPISDRRGVQGWVIHVDGFGNCITNISKTDFDVHQDGRPMKCYVGSTTLESVRLTYDDAEKGEPVALFGSFDMLEIAVNAGNASELLSIRKGDPVNVIFHDDP